MPTINKKFAYIRDGHESLFTILIYDTDKEKILNDLKKRLEKIKEIKNTFKKQKLNDRLYKLILNIESSQKQNYNNIILVSDEIKFIDLTTTDINMLREFTISNYSFEYGEYFKIDWLTGLFENLTYYDIVIFNSSQYTHYLGNKYKKKKITQTSSQDLLKNIQNKFYLVGKINSLKPDFNKNLIEHIQTNMTWEQILEYIRQNEIKKQVEKLSDIIKNITIDSDSYIYGTEIYDAIESYNIKELYIHKDFYNEFENKIIELKLEDSINFKLDIIETLNSNSLDSSTILLKDFNGMIGIKYF